MRIENVPKLICVRWT